jgi:hypothetical protein
MPSSKVEERLTLMKPLQPSEVAAAVRGCIGNPDRST